jgi:hypothetical protein
MLKGFTTALTYSVSFVETIGATTVSTRCQVVFTYADCCFTVETLHEPHVETVGTIAVIFCYSFVVLVVDLTTGTASKVVVTIAWLTQATIVTVVAFVWVYWFTTAMATFSVIIGNMLGTIDVTIDHMFLTRKHLLTTVTTLKDITGALLYWWVMVTPRVANVIYSHSLWVNIWIVTIEIRSNT